MAEKITDKLVRNLEAPVKGNRVIYDAEVKGFGIRITAAGAKSFVYNYRVKDTGRERRITLGAYGPHPGLSVEAARRDALAKKKIRDAGGDPMGDLHGRRAAPTVKDLAKRYEEEHLPRKRPGSQREDRRNLENHILPAIGNIKVADLQYEDLDRLHRSMSNRPYAANRVIALVSKMLSLSIRWKMRADNPAKSIERFQEDKRKRYLDSDERIRLLDAMQEHASRSEKAAQTVSALRLAMLTGARIGECLSATWDQFDLERSQWIKPASNTKQRQEHTVHLNSPALALLTEMQARGTGEYLFRHHSGEGHQVHYQKHWDKICEAAKLEGVRVHDLRHSFASEGASVGLSLPMIGALLGHSSPTSTARYAHLFDDPLKKASEQIGARLVANNGNESNVTPLRK